MAPNAQHSDEEYVPLKEESYYSDDAPGGSAHPVSQSQPQQQPQFAYGVPAHEGLYDDPIQQLEKEKGIAWLMLSTGIFSLLPLILLQWTILVAPLLIVSASVVLCECCNLSTRVNTAHATAITGCAIGAPFSLLHIIAAFSQQGYALGTLSILWALVTCITSAGYAMRLGPIRNAMQPVSRNDFV